MTSIAGAAGSRRPVVGGTFERSLLAAAARGAVLVGIAVLAGIGLLRVTDDTVPPGPEEILTGGTDVTTTTRFGTGTVGTTPGGEDPGTAGGIRQPSQVRVLVLNGARISGVAGVVSDELGAKGYQMAPPENAPDQSETVVYYKVGFEGEATILAQEVSPNAYPEELTDPSPFPGTENVDLVVVIGKEYRAQQQG